MPGIERDGEELPRLSPGVGCDSMAQGEGDYPPCSGSSVDSPLTKAFHRRRLKTTWAALVLSRLAEWISCLMESARLVLGLICRKQIEHNKNMYCCFIDYSKALTF